ncbi:putative PurR-regulated permease PerM [Anaerobacterium chartisolvens]|uniref:Putative PurR-regulated permease PerM n=1 Tax=Anaerobacterium chartisolvens TaxID=1297424 RepID=A0A369AZM4_9FIRM|nr:AI-2E family transporter [Anaerobacterium chartisolvens]RCX13788.1 putative PurR-regulated permease PerM [Anaerobacterium chartisolvens]
MSTKKRVALAIITVLLLSALILFFYTFKKELGKILTPFIMAIVIAYLVSPVAGAMERKKIPRSAAIIFIYLLFMLAAITTVIFIMPELIKNIKDLMGTIPEITEGYRSLFNSVSSFIISSGWPEDIKSAIFSEVQNSVLMAQNYVADKLKDFLAGFVETVGIFLDVILSMVIAYYFIKDAEAFKEGALSLLPRRWRNGMVDTAREINVILAGFIQGQLLVAVIIGVLETIGLLIVNVKYAVVLGFIGGLANIIPYFGPFIGAVPAVAIAFMESPAKALWTAVVFTIIQQIDNSFISPKIIEGRLGLHPVSTIAAVLAGAQFFGIVGMLFAVPVAAVIKVIIKRSIEAIV